MKRLTLSRRSFAGQSAFLFLIGWLAGVSEAADLPPFTLGKSTVSFTVLPEQAHPDEPIRTS